MTFKKKTDAKSCFGSDVTSLLWFGDDIKIVPLPENDENFLYFPNNSENPNTSISDVAFKWIFLKFPMQVEKSSLNPNITRFLKYLPQIVNFGPALDIMNTTLVKKGPNS